jgi:hypothetical protein
MLKGASLSIRARIFSSPVGKEFFNRIGQEQTFRAAR